MDALAPAPSVAILATGDEILQGDILNSNSQAIAHLLFEQGFKPGLHMSVGDDKFNIQTCIQYLLKLHKALIITGGLGPTTDDLTRFALSQAINKPLILDTTTCQLIELRLKKYGFTHLPKNNQQQALFPEGAIIIPNDNGTAAGCFVEHEGAQIFMLPGPPPECIPMIDAFVIPCLRQSQFQQKRYYKKWFLFGVSEGHIAEELENIVKNFECTTGYRITFPYVEFKIYSTNLEDFNQVKYHVEKKIKTFMIGNGENIASDILKKYLLTQSRKLYFQDSATGGILESILKTPETHSHLNFSGGPVDENNLHITLNGLNEYWHQLDTPLTEFKLAITIDDMTKTFLQEIPLRGPRVKIYLAEYTCRQILALLDKLPSKNINTT